MPEDNKPAQNQTPKTSSGDNDVLMGVLAYLGILCLIPLLAAKDSDFAQYHAKQGLTLFVVEIGVMILNWVVIFISIASSGFGFILYPLVWLVGVGTLVLSIIGIVNVVGKKKVPLPIIGGIQIMK